jgi:hypothetical protein
MSDIARRGEHNNRDAFTLVAILSGAGRTVWSDTRDLRQTRWAAVGKAGRMEAKMCSTTSRD